MYTEMNDEFAFARPYLAPGEAILWCGFAIFWFVTALINAPLPFTLFGVPFVCMGLYMTVGRFFHAAWLRENTAYVITTGKIIRRRGNKIDMLDAKTMPAIHVTARTDGTGTIQFGQPTYYHRRGYGYNGWSPNGGIFTLENIPDVARVQHILHSIAGN